MDLTALFAQGGPAAIIAVLLGVVGKLWIDGKDKDERIYALQESRLSDTKEALGSISAAVKTVEATINALQTLGRK